MWKYVSLLFAAANASTELWGIDYKSNGPVEDRFANIVRIKLDREADTCDTKENDDDTVVCKIYDQFSTFEPADNANRQAGLAYDYVQDVVYWTAKCTDGAECVNNDFYLLKTANPGSNATCSPTIVSTSGFSIQDSGTLSYHNGFVYFLAKVAGGDPGAPFQILALDTTTNVVGQACGDSKIMGDSIEVDPNGFAWVFTRTGGGDLSVFDLNEPGCGVGVGDKAVYEYDLNFDDDFTGSGPTKITMAFGRNLAAADCCSWSSEGICPNGCDDLGSGCDYSLYVVNQDNARIGYINHKCILDNLEQDSVDVVTLCDGDSFLRESGEQFVITDMARTEQIFFTPPDECGEDEFSYDVLGHSGKINIANGEDKAQITMDFLWERDANNTKIKVPSHSINSFANQEFYWFEAETTSLAGTNDSSRIRFFSCLHGEHDRKTPDLDSKNLNSPQLDEAQMESFCSDNHATTAFIAVDIYRFESCPDICEAFPDADVTQGSLKWSVTIRNYQYCNQNGDDCVKKGAQIISKYLEFGFEFKASFLGDGDVLGGGADLDLGNGWEMRLDTEVQVNNVTVADSLDDFMEITSNSNKALFKIRVEIPQSQDTVNVTYDPFLKQKERKFAPQWEFSFQPSSSSEESKPFPTGAVVGSLVGVGAVAGAFILYRRNKKQDEIETYRQRVGSIAQLPNSIKSLQDHPPVLEYV